MTSFQIKLIAVATMLIDHIGLFFFPETNWLRLIGRLAFPLFAWSIANGARHTHDIKKYLKRLFIFALIAQIPFIFANRLLDPNFRELNVLFTLFLGLLLIAVIQNSKNHMVSVIAVFIGLISAHLLNVDFGLVGVLSILAFYLFYDRFIFLAAAEIAIFISPYLLAFLVNTYAGEYISASISNYNGLLAPLSLVFIYFYTGREGSKTKYVLYFFYPFQYLIYFVLKSII
jgi:hypothetical protein